MLLPSTPMPSSTWFTVDGSGHGGKRFRVLRKKLQVGDLKVYGKLSMAEEEGGTGGLRQVLASQNRFLGSVFSTRFYFNCLSVYVLHMFPVCGNLSLLAIVCLFCSSGVYVCPADLSKWKFNIVVHGQGVGWPDGEVVLRRMCLA